MLPRAGVTSLRAVVEALFAALLFGAATPASKRLLGDVGPVALAGLLYLGAALATAPAVVLRRRRSGARRRADRASRMRLAAAVLLGGVIGPVLFLEGLRSARAGSVALLLNLEMAFTAVAGASWFREPLGRRGWLGVAGILAAGALVSGAGGWPGMGSALAVAGACACWAFDNHLLALVDGIPPVQSTFWKGTAGAAVNLGLARLAGPLGVGGGAIAAALATGALAYGASIALAIAASQQLGATRAQALFATAPFLGAGLAWGLLAEPVTAPQVLAVLLLVPSIAALLATRHEHPHAHPGIEHVHAHRHDDGHHDHAHPGLPLATTHTHWHRHELRFHAHPHWPDLHHRHGHGGP
jgi:drug/metabolite transporter (DMT)-like permease